MKISKAARKTKSLDKCRCCQSPSQNFLDLEIPAKAAGSLEKTYKDLLYEITHLKIPPDQEKAMPQKICTKCGTQLKNSHKFIQQACEITEQYLQLTSCPKEEQKSFEDLHETLIELPDNSLNDESNDQIKVEPLDAECIPKEAVIIEEINLTKNETDQNQVNDNANIGDIHEERDLMENSKTDSSEDDDNGFEPISEDDMEADFSNEPIARSCDICHKVYRNEKFLRIHKRYTHMPEEEKLPCPLCAYKASRSSALKVHMGLVHGADKVSEYFKPVLDSGKKYPCSQCPRSYGRKDSLRKHIRRKHQHKSAKETSRKKLKTPKEKVKERFLCTYCGQSYSSKCGLESHILTHTGERPYSCDICSKTFKRLKDLQLHRVIHSDEKPHQCSECGKAFKRVDKLKIHMRVHSELRPYKCKECDKTFKYPSVLRTHMHIHNGLTPFACKTCGVAFSLRTSLNNHCLKNGHIK